MIDLRRLLTDELAACRAYQRAFAQLPHATVRALTPLHREHRIAAGLLRNTLAQRHVRGRLDTACRWRMLGLDQGVLGGLYGPRAIVQWLRHGEAKGLAHVRSVASARAAGSVRALLADRIVPRLHNNVLILDQVLERNSNTRRSTPADTRLYHA